MLSVIAQEQVKRSKNLIVTVNLSSAVLKGIKLATSLFVPDLMLEKGSHLNFLGHRSGSQLVPLRGRPGPSSQKLAPLTHNGLTSLQFLSPSSGSLTERLTGQEGRQRATRSGPLPVLFISLFVCLFVSPYLPVGT